MTETDQQTNPAQNEAPAADAPTTDAPAATTEAKKEEPVVAAPDMVDEMMDKCCVDNKTKYIAMGVAGTVGLVYGIWTIYQGVYGYSSSDPAHAYYIEGVDKTGITKDAVTALATEANVTVKAGYPVDMGHLFRSWFKWGFWGSFLNILLMAAFFPLRKFCPGYRKMMKLAYMGAYGALAVNAMIWFILGFFWRYSRAGRIAAGDKITDRSSVNMNA